MEDLTPFLYGLGGLAFGLLLFQRWNDPLSSIPTVGPSAPILSYWGAVRFVYHAREMLSEGYEKYRDSVFKIAMPDRWLVIVNGPKLLDELRKFPDDQMSFTEAVEELIHARQNMGPDVVDEPYHISAIRNQLTRNLGALLPSVVDEIQIAFKQFIPVHNDEWLSINALPVMMQIVARASNRIFVGLPKCRDADYLNIAIGFTGEIAKSQIVTNLFPAVLHPIVLRLFPFTRKSIKRAAAHFKPIIEGRFEQLELHGDEWPEKPNDMLMWLMDEARVRGSPAETIVNKIMVVNFAAIHTSSNSITHALYDLAAHPEYTQPLREEIDAAIKIEGWTKESVAKMWKLDSFLRESQRMNGVSGVSVTRKALQDVTLSNGVCIPAGTFVAVASTATHHNADRYSDPLVFDPFRFSSMRKEGQGNRVQYVNTSVDYIPFGVGVHACPGRFFAASELKCMLAHIVLNFDVKLEDEGGRPSNVWFGPTVAPAPNAKVMFRRRLDVPN